MIEFEILKAVTNVMIEFEILKAVTNVLILL